MTTLYGLVDCNNFYCSCERAFNPQLHRKPVVVLSNNDGCIISRSQEAKDLGIQMGEPLFKVKDLLEAHHVAVYSSNYTLYGDMSRRVMSLFHDFTPNVEVYSIDEAFLDFSNLYGVDLHQHAWKLKSHVFQCTDIPVSVGVAATKTLAKVANRISKKSKKANGVLVLTDPYYLQAALKQVAVEDVWGIGHQYAALLHRHNLHTAYDLSRVRDAWAKKHLSIVGLRLVQELRGEPCLDLELEPPAKKGICTSKAFGVPVTDYGEVKEALATYTARCAEKLRKQQSGATLLTVFIQTNPFANTPQYYDSRTVRLPVATNSELEMIQYALQALQTLYRKGYSYKKTGIIVSEIVPQDTIQFDVFDTVNRDKHIKLMAAKDALKVKMGRPVVNSAALGTQKRWTFKRAMLSPCYTTRMSDILEVH